MKKIILITCVAPKLKQPAPAKKLYQGALFEKLLAFAEAEQADHQFILSGKYGLLQMNEVIEPYDVNLNLVSDEELKTWSENVLKKLSTYADFEQDYFILLTNPIYAKHLIPSFKNYVIPFNIE